MTTGMNRSTFRSGKKLCTFTTFVNWISIKLQPRHQGFKFPWGTLFNFFDPTLIRFKSTLVFACLVFCRTFVVWINFLGFLRFWIFFKELLWFGISIQKDFNFLASLDFFKRTFVVWIFQKKNKPSKKILILQK